MQILVLSDLHLEFMERDHPSVPEEFIRSLDPTVDVVVLAGDITIGALLKKHLELFRAHFVRSDILYVPGNHEYYGSTFEHVHTTLSNFEEDVENFHWLRPGVTVERDGQRFLGATLWYDNDTARDSYLRTVTPARQHEAGMRWSDFRHIGDPENIFTEAAAHEDWLRRYVRKGDIVVTHMLPSTMCVTPRWAKSDTNCFFVNDLDDVLFNEQPGLWIHGHTHDSCDHVIGATRVVCNPHDYHPNQQPEFDKDFIIEF